MLNESFQVIGQRQLSWKAAGQSDIIMFQCLREYRSLLAGKNKSVKLSVKLFAAKSLNGFSLCKFYERCQ